MALAVAGVDRLRRREEAAVLGRADLDQLRDRRDATGSEDRGRPIEPSGRGDPVVCRGGEDGIGTVGGDVDALEVADGDVEAI